MQTLRASADTLGQIVDTVAAIAGEDLSPYRPELFRDATLRRVGRLGLSSTEAYLDRLEMNPDEACLMLQEAFVGVTEFFRDPEAFDALSHHLAHRFARHPHPLQCYVAACSTGQEALSVFMLLDRLCSALDLPEPAPLVATDINPHAIEQARQTSFEPAQIHGLSPSILRQFFFRYAGRYTLRKRYQARVRFSVADILRVPPRGRFDLICCRNLLIYLLPSAQHKLLHQLYRALRPGGLLVLGAYESAFPLPGLFALVDARHSIYARRC